MTHGSSKKSGDNALGMNIPICRRDFLNASLVGSGSVLLAGLNPAQLLAAETSADSSNWNGPSGVGDYSLANGNTLQVVTTAHGIRDGLYDGPSANAIDSGEEFDCVVVGGGISGLSAALFYRDGAGPGRKCLVLENHPIFGGEARRNEFLVDGKRLMAPQGAVQFPIPHSGGLIDRFYREVGLNYWEFRYQNWEGSSPPMPLGRTIYSQSSTLPPTFGFYFGARFGQRPGLWLRDPISNGFSKAPVSDAVRKDFVKIFQRRQKTGPTDNPPFKYWGDEVCHQLDAVTLEDYLIQHAGISRETIRSCISPELAGGFGLGADVVSAFIQYCYLPARDFSYETGLQMSPGGLAGLARHTVKTLIPDSIEGDRGLHDVCCNKIDFATLDRPDNPVRIRLSSTVVRVEHEGGDPYTSKFVWVSYVRDGKIYRVKAHSVVMASGGWVTRHIVRDLPETHRRAYDQFYYGPYLRANVAVRNWRFLERLGLSGGRWFEGFGMWTEVRKVATFGADSESIGPDSPTVLSIDQSFVHPGLPAAEQGAKGRMQLLSTSFRDFERQIRETMTDMFAQSGFDARRDISGIILNRWGHALVSPQPGFFFGLDGKPAPRDVLRYRPFGRIAFSHTDLAGGQDHASSITESHRAVSQILEATW